jgi:hypothetical protein
MASHSQLGLQSSGTPPDPHWQSVGYKGCSAASTCGCIRLRRVTLPYAWATGWFVLSPRIFLGIHTFGSSVGGCCSLGVLAAGNAASSETLFIGDFVEPLSNDAASNKSLGCDGLGTDTSNGTADAACFHCAPSVRFPASHESKICDFVRLVSSMAVASRLPVDSKGRLACNVRKPICSSTDTGC